MQELQKQLTVVISACSSASEERRQEAFSARNVQTPCTCTWIQSTQI